MVKLSLYDFKMVHSLGILIGFYIIHSILCTEPSIFRKNICLDTQLIADYIWMIVKISVKMKLISVVYQVLLIFHLLVKSRKVYKINFLIIEINPS